MVKRNKLYTANKWNQPLFAQGVDREHQNIFDGMFSSTITPADLKVSGNNPGVISPTPNLDPTKNSLPKSIPSPSSTSPLSGTLKGDLLGAAGNIVGKAGYGLLSGGLNSGAGSAINSLGSAAGNIVGKFNPVLGAAISGAAGIIGGGINALVGTKVDQAKLQAANSGTAQLNNFTSTASDFDGITGPQDVANVENAYKGGLFKKGWAKRRNAALRDNRVRAMQFVDRSIDNNAENIAEDQMHNNLANYAALGGQLNTDDNMGAIDYNFMSDYLTAKNKAAEAKSRIPGNVFGNLPVTPFSTYASGGGIHIKKSHEGLFTEEAKRNGMGVQEFASHVLAHKDQYSPEVVKRANFARNATKFALGGDLQSHGSDWGNVMHIDAGDSHENNPNEGVQLGIDSQGKPNLVEEGETVFNDYVYSKRIKVDAQTKKKFHLPKDSDMSFADVSKKLEKESAERPNDPISKTGLERQLGELAEEQERQKAERAQKEFAALPPEQQQAIIQQVAQEQQAAQQEAIAQQGGTSQEDTQGMDEQQLAGQQQAAAEQMQQEQLMEQPQEDVQMQACGGPLNNKYAEGGDMKSKIYKLIKDVYTDREFNKWAEKHKIDTSKIDFTKPWDNKALMDAIAKDDPSIKYAIDNGYRFNGITPITNNLTFDFKHGGWGAEDYEHWKGSTDAAWQEAVKKGLVKDGMKSADIAKALSQTDAYKRGSKWLQDSEDNRLKYLQAIYNNSDAPKAAKDYAAKYVDANGWVNGAARDYKTIFEDPNGVGVRNTHPGTYWKTPNEVFRNKVSKNLVINDDGSIDEIVGDVPTDWKQDKAYSWTDKDVDNYYNFYRRPTAKTPEKKVAEEEFDVKPVLKDENLRYVGLLGPAVALGMQGLGIGKPNMSGVNAAVTSSNQSPVLSSYKPLGNYLQYTPMDIWYEQNKLNANARATDRAIMNNNASVGTKMAGLLASGYNDQLGSGELYRKALEYNDANRKAVAEFNRGTDQYNADAYTKNSMANAEAINRSRQFAAQMAMSAAEQQMQNDAAWNQSIYGNVNNIFKGISELGKENAQHNMIARMAADGIFGTMGNQNIGKGYTQRVPKNKSSKGGKINRRKGLTF